MKRNFINKLIYVLIAVALLGCTEVKQEPIHEFAQWRGFLRDGIYPDTNLLTSWPENGPEMKWSYDTLGNGYGSPVVSGNRVYVAGEIDSLAYIFALDTNGRVVWKSNYGQEWISHYPGCRTTPTLKDSLLYVCSGTGNLACLKSENGEILWNKNLVSDLNGRIPFFGYSQSVLLIDSIVYAMPGGVDTNFVALNRFTGDIVWISKGKGEPSAYNSPMYFEWNGRKIIATFSVHQFLGFDASTGDVLWSKHQDAQYPNHANTAIFDNGSLYIAVSCGNGIFRYDLTQDTSFVKQIWGHDSLMFNYFGGMIKLKDKLYSTCEDSRKMKVLKAETGELTDSLDTGKGAIIFADGLLYCYSDKGVVSLVNPGDSLSLISSFKVKKGTKEHFAHPVIQDGILYIRHGESLFAYDIKEK